MIITVFRNRLRPEHEAEYVAAIGRISDLARSMPGYISHKSFAAPDGERVTIVEFADEGSHRAWAIHPEHRLAQARGARGLLFRILDPDLHREPVFPLSIALN